MKAVRRQNGRSDGYMSDLVTQFVPDEVLPTLRVTIYNTPHDQRELLPHYTLHAEVHPNATDPKNCWVVIERIDYWDEAGPNREKKSKIAMSALNAADPAHCLTIEESQEGIKKQVSFRASRGFKYLFTLDPFGVPWFKRDEVQSDGSWWEMLD